ncbi:hypothetical protein A8W25_31105 [Streptomyces sp. ERV7]|nr:hypothetical protein A8W25_31105 [Streptomyces sp. ERV7]
MKKITSVTALVLAGVALAAPAHADGPNGSSFSGPVSTADNWNFSAGVVCMQETAIVPALGGTPGFVGDHDNNCANGNVIDHS